MNIHYIKSILLKLIFTGTILLVLSTVFATDYLHLRHTKQYLEVPNSCDCYATSKLNNLKIQFNNQVPGDINTFNQSTANCFAWQEFISLNWPTDITKSFGDPYDYNPVQWETYMPKEVLFQANGVAPPAWGTLVSEQYALKFKTQRLMINKIKTKLLTFSSKTNGNSSATNFSPDQAAPSTKPNWLGAQNGTNLWYEIMLNKDYYDYVVRTGFYNAKTQHDAVQAGTAIDFPKGIYNGKTGAIELKVAWMEADTPTAAKWKRYKLSKATVMDPITGKLRNTTVALVGLHILHKTQNQPTWVWATFEQIDNVPGNSTPPAGYNFYNANCVSKNVSFKTATQKDTTVTVSCTPNTSPPFYLNQANAVPIQISRKNPIDPINAAPINLQMQNNIKGLYPNSVWQYYQLVDVIWSQGVQPSLTPPANKPFPLNTSSMASGVPIVANTTMESYVQGSNTCFSCHIYSSIAPYPADAANNNKFGDFSFAIQSAKYPVTKVAGR
jgi:hypothetical protein